MRIRDEAPDDHAAIHAIVLAAFGQDDEAQLVDRLRAEVPGYLALVAEDEDGTLVGHIAFTPVSIANGASGWQGLAPVSVSPDAQGRGVGAALVRAGLERCREHDARGVALLGSPDYYARFGFRAAGGFGLHYAGAPFPEAFQALELAPGALDAARGEVRYAAPFEAVG